MKKIIVLLSSLLLVVGCQSTAEEVADMSAYDIDDGNFLVANMADSIELLTSGDNIVYFGFDDCPWCIELIYEFDKTLEENNLKAYYVNVKADGEEVRVKENPEYLDLLEIVGSYVRTLDDGTKHMYVPMIFIVKDGIITKVHNSTVEGHNAKERKMTEEEVEELRGLLTELVS